MFGRVRKYKQRCPSLGVKAAELEEVRNPRHGEVDAPGRPRWAGHGGAIVAAQAEFPEALKGAAIAGRVRVQWIRGKGTSPTGLSQPRPAHRGPNRLSQALGMPRASYPRWWRTTGVHMPSGREYRPGGSETRTEYIAGERNLRIDDDEADARKKLWRYLSRRCSPY